MKMALIPPGEFFVTPEYRVRLTKPYYLGIHEVTVGQFRQFVKETSYRTDVEVSGVGGLLHNFKTKNPGNPKPEYIWSNRSFSPTDQHPVVFVTWNDAQKFCAWLSKKEKKTYRLPTDAEWEWASRAGAVPDPKTMEAVGWFAGNSGKKSQPVGKLSANAFGLFDMFGNVHEFCEDWWSPFSRGTAIDPQGPREGLRRVVRGGGFAHPPEGHQIVAFPLTLAMYVAGFRVTCEVPPKAATLPSVK